MTDGYKWRSIILDSGADIMTYYQRLVQRAMAAMDQFPRSTVALDAENLTVLARSRSASKVARSAQRALARGRTPVIVEKPRREETWIL